MEDLSNKSNKKTPKEIADSIDEKLMNLEINDGDISYGIVCEIRETNGSFKVYTNLGYSFNAGLILNLIALSNLNEKAEQKAAENTDENIQYLAPAFIDNQRLSNKVMSRPKPMAHSKQLRSNGSINNNAVIGDEVINITSHVSGKVSFPEENEYKQQNRRIQ